MRYCLFDEPHSTYDVAILIKPSAFEPEMMEKYYVDILNKLGLDHLNIIAYELEYNSKKVKAKEGKAYLEKLKNNLAALQVKYIYVADAEYFKLLTGLKKGEAHLNEIIEVDGFYVTIGINYASIKYNPLNRDKLKMSLETIKSHINNEYSKVGSNIIHSSIMCIDSVSSSKVLQDIHNYKLISCDIESYSLSHFNAGISTIGFAWDCHNGAVISCDYSNAHKPNEEIYSQLKHFFDNYQGKIIFHNASYDVKVLIYTLYMQHDLDYVGLNEGIEVFSKLIHDTKVMAYVGLNSTHKPNLGLKDLALPFAGNYAEDVKDVKKLPLDRLMKYNLVDCLSTFWVFEQFNKQLIEEQLFEVYETIMMDSVILLLEVELVGIPINLARVAEVKSELELKVLDNFNTFQSFNEIQETMTIIRQEELDKNNKKLKKTKHTIDMQRYQDIVFNPNSPNHLRVLLYDVLGLPVLKRTATKLPSTGAKVIKELTEIAKPKQKQLLEALVEYSGVVKLLTAFIPAFEKSRLKENGHWLHGSFVVGGTVSGRLSSNSPNLQNLPSSGNSGKLIKSCFSPPEGYVFCGADFNALNIY